MRKKLFCALCSMFIVVVMLAGCAKSNPSVVGCWQSTITDEITVEFNSDGTITEYWEDSITNDESTYLVDDNKVTIEQNGNTFAVDLVGDELVYMDEIIYKRIS